MQIFHWKRRIFFGNSSPSVLRSQDPILGYCGQQGTDGRQFVTELTYTNSSISCSKVKNDANAMVHVSPNAHSHIGFAPDGHPKGLEVSDFPLLHHSGPEENSTSRYANVCVNKLQQPFSLQEIMHRITGIIEVDLKQ